MRTFIISCLLSFATVFLLTAQKNYDVSSIPEKLLENSDAVVRYSSTNFAVNDMKSGVEKHTYIITVLNKKGEDLSIFSCYGDKSRSISRFSGEIYDKNGKSLRKIKKSELKSTEYLQEGLASDIITYFMKPQTPMYPYTVKYEYEILWKNGMIGFPSFVPIPSINTSVEIAKYTLSLPKGFKFKYKQINTSIIPTDKNDDKSDIYEWEIDSIAPIPLETFSPSYVELAPIVYFTPIEFLFNNTTGSLQNWGTFGQWQCSLLKDRDVLPEQLKQKIHDLTNNLPSTREKVKALYEYLGQNTRYVSIQLGIGGWQPMSATEVYNTKFGDCKALSNYMKAMLQECGITSNYTTISTLYKRLYEDFPSLLQMNHVILQVPLEKDTLWLECTNTEVPFGYVHNSIAGHDAIMYKNDTGYFITLKDYPDSTNISSQKTDVIISENGSTQMTIQQQYINKKYEEIWGILKKDEKERTNRIRDMVNLPSATVGNIETKDNKNSTPQININFKANTDSYGTVSNKRFFMPVNPLRNYEFNFQEKRHHDIVVNNGYCNMDTIVLNFPQYMDIEAIPQPVSITTEYGTFTMDIKSEKKGEIAITQKFILKTGRYPREDASKFQEFLSTVKKHNGSSIILVNNK